MAEQLETPQPDTTPETTPETPVSEPAQPASPPPAPSWREQLRSQGIELPDDDQQAIQAVQNYYRAAQQHQQVAPYLPYVQTYMQHAPQFQQWMQEQSRPKAQPQQDQPWYSSYWNPPEYNPSWQTQVTTDAQGNYVPAPGAPPDVAVKFQQYQQFRRDQVEKLLSNPYTFFEPAIRQLAQEEAQRITQEHLGNHQSVIAANQFVEQNAPWLYEQNPDGGLKRGPNGQPQLSQWGQRFQQYVMQEDQRQRARGYSDIAEQRDYAMDRVMRDYAMYELSRQQQTGQPAQPAQTPLQAANQQFIQKNAGRAPVRQGGNANPPKPPVTRANLYQAMTERAAAAGAL